MKTKASGWGWAWPTSRPPWIPGMFVIGGGLCDAGELLAAPARESFARNLTGRGFRPMARIELAALGPHAGLIGAADLSRVSGRAHG